MLGASIAVSIGFQILLPPPFGFIAALAFFLVLPFIAQKKLQARMMGSNLQVKYRCLVCQKHHNLSQCPRCGSNMKKADFAG